jgi:hypothetical protein
LPSLLAIDPLIAPDFPSLFVGFRGKHFSRLYRRGRDGFGARDFHIPCDGHAPTLILIWGTEGNIFAGVTLVMWESGNGQLKSDLSLRKFVFMLKNPHNFQARRFALKVEKKDQAIQCLASFGPVFLGSILQRKHLQLH